MKCTEVREVLPELAADFASPRMVHTSGNSASPTSPAELHVGTCAACAAELAELCQTMALLDEWMSPEPSPYFDTRLMARVREEQTLAVSRSGWLQWLRKPVMALALATVLVGGTGVYKGWIPGYGSQGNNGPIASVVVQRGSAVSDLQALDDNHDMYSDFEVLDDLQPQGSAQPQSAAQTR